jgi:hypothetical protein
MKLRNGGKTATIRGARQQREAEAKGAEEQYTQRSVYACLHLGFGRVSLGAVESTAPQLVGDARLADAPKYVTNASKL